MYLVCHAITLYCFQKIPVQHNGSDCGVFACKVSSQIFALKYIGIHPSMLVTRHLKKSMYRLCLLHFTCMCDQAHACNHLTLLIRIIIPGFAFCVTSCWVELACMHC